MKRLIFDKYICPKDGHITIVNPAATSSLAYMLDCGDCCDCKERAKYYGKGNGKLDFPKSISIHRDEIKNLDKTKLSKNSIII